MFRCQLIRRPLCWAGRRACVPALDGLPTGIRIRLPLSRRGATLVTFLGRVRTLPDPSQGNLRVRSGRLPFGRRGVLGGVWGFLCRLGGHGLGRRTPRGLANCGRRQRSFRFAPKEIFLKTQTPLRGTNDVKGAHRIISFPLSHPIRQPIDIPTFTSHKYNPEL